MNVDRTERMLLGEEGEGMETATFTERYQRIAAEFDAKQGCLQIQRQGDRLVFLTGGRSVKQSRFFARILGVALGILGVTLISISPWTLLLTLVGVTAALFAPEWIRPIRLLEIDAENGDLLVCHDRTGDRVTVPMDAIVRIEGRYETQGWDAMSAFDAVLEDGAQVLILTLRGTDEVLAGEVCRGLGLLLDRPAAYAGPFGGVKDYRPPTALVG